MTCCLISWPLSRSCSQSGISPTTLARLLRITSVARLTLWRTCVLGTKRFRGRLKLGRLALRLLHKYSYAAPLAHRATPESPPDAAPASRPLPAQRAADMHETRIIDRCANFRAGIQQATNFIRQHGRGNIGVLDGECATKPAAFLRLRGISTRSSRARLQATRAGRSPSFKRTQRMAGRMQCHGVRKERTHIGYT